MLEQQPHINTVTVIYHEARIALGLSRTEYEIAQLIYNLQTSPRSLMSGWCRAGISKIARLTGFGKATVSRALERLRKLQIIALHSEEKAIQTTSKWYKIAVKPFQKRSITEHSRLKTFQNGKETFQNGKETFQNGMKTFQNGMKTFQNGKETFQNGTHNDLEEDLENDLELEERGGAASPENYLQDLEKFEKQILDFFFEKPRMKSDLMNRAFFLEGRDGNFSEVVRSMVEKRSHLAEFRNRPIFYFLKNASVWLKTQKSIKSQQNDRSKKSVPKHLVTSDTAQRAMAILMRDDDDETAYAFTQSGSSSGYGSPYADPPHA